MSAATAFLAILMGSRALVNTAVTQQQIASQAKLLNKQAGLIRQSADEAQGLAYEQAVLYGRTAAENARAVELQGDQALMYEEIAGMQRVAGIRAKTGSSGASVNVGTPAQLQIAQEQANQFNQRVLNYNTKYESARIHLEKEQRITAIKESAKLQHDQAYREAAYYDEQAAEVRATKALATLSSLLGGAASVLSVMPAASSQPLQPEAVSTSSNFYDFMNFFNRQTIDYNSQYRMSGRERYTQKYLLGNG